MKKVALVTELMGPNLSPGDSLLVSPLQKLGIQAIPVAWDDSHVDWAFYDALILRACWHYPDQHARFRDWINELAGRRVPVWNHPDIVLWNMDKRYLLDLAGSGIPIVPTVWLNGGAPPDLEHILIEKGWTEAVVKPQISTSSDNTWRVAWPPAQEDQDRFDTLAAERALMVQKLMPEIADGEWSLLFVAGSFSHAVLKRPAHGEIFVQEQRGGAIHAAEALEGLVESARRMVRLAEDLIGQSTLYARVDGLNIEGHLTLMELELIEPSLYMRYHPQAAERLARAIARRVT